MAAATRTGGGRGVGRRRGYLPGTHLHKERENQKRFFLGGQKPAFCVLFCFVSQRVAQRLPYARGLSCTAAGGVLGRGVGGMGCRR